MSENDIILRINKVLKKNHCVGKWRCSKELLVNVVQIILVCSCAGYWYPHSTSFPDDLFRNALAGTTT
jgi:hypothetical protein